MIEGTLPTLEGYRLRLRAPTAQDLPALHAWYNDPETVAPFDRFSVDAFADFEAEVQRAPKDPLSLAPRFVLERKDDHRMIGFVGHYQPHPVLETIDVWYVLGERSERGKGFGTEAVGLLVDYLFHTLGVERVGATIDVENLASYKLVEHLKFRREGILKSALFHHGRWHDVAVYGVTRSEWSQRPRRE